MAQSKKDLLKTVSRRCAQAGRALAYTAYTAGDLALLDTYGQLRRDIQETMHQLRRPSSTDLWDVGQPVTFEHVDHLRSRLIALQSRLIPATHRKTVM